VQRTSIAAKASIAAAFLALVLLGCAKSGPSALPEVIVHKSPSCSCCKLWAERRTYELALEIGTF